MNYQEAIKSREILSKYKTKRCKKPDDQCKFRSFSQKDTGEIVVLCTGSHNLADERRNPFVDAISSSIAYSAALCDQFNPLINTCPHATCTKCRNLFEYNYHPENFKRIKCQYYESRKFCRLGAKCFRYHEREEAECWMAYWENMKFEELESKNRQHSSFFNFEPVDIADQRTQPNTGYITPREREESSDEKSVLSLTSSPNSSTTQGESSAAYNNTTVIDNLDSQNFDSQMSRSKITAYLESLLFSLNFEEKGKILSDLEKKVDEKIVLFEKYQQALEGYRMSQGFAK